jgi:hypothetical protein
MAIFGWPALPLYSGLKWPSGSGRSPSYSVCSPLTQTGDPLLKYCSVSIASLLRLFKRGPIIAFRQIYAMVRILIPRRTNPSLASSQLLPRPISTILARQLYEIIVHGPATCLPLLPRPHPLASSNDMFLHLTEPLAPYLTHAEDVLRHRW